MVREGARAPLLSQGAHHHLIVLHLVLLVPHAATKGFRRVGGRNGSADQFIVVHVGHGLPEVSRNANKLLFFMNLRHIHV